MIEWDARMRQEYYDPIERFPERIDLLLNAINRVCLRHSQFSIEYFSISFSFTSVKSKVDDFHLM